MLLYLREHRERLRNRLRRQVSGYFQMSKDYWGPSFAFCPSSPSLFKQTNKHSRGWKDRSAVKSTGWQRIQVQFSARRAARVWNIFHQCLYFPYFSHFPNTWDPRSGRAFCICSRWEIQCVHPVANSLHVKDIQP